MRRILAIVLIVIMAFLSVSCKKEEYVSESSEPTLEGPTIEMDLENSDESSEGIMSITADKLGITHENYPIIDGSTSTLGIVEGINRAMYEIAKMIIGLKQHRKQ